MRRLVHALLLSAVAAPALAAPRALTPAEARVCDSVEQCADIAARHGPESFDYAVLASEFARLPDAAPMLLRLAEDGRAPRVEALLLQDLDGELAADFAVAAIAQGGETARSLTGSLAPFIALDATRVDLPLSALADYAADHTSAKLVPLIQRHGEAGRPVLAAALSSGDARYAGAAYQALFDADPDAALRTLVETMRATDDIDPALAIGRMLALRAQRNPFYARMLDDIARDAGYSVAMRDGARAGSLAVSGASAPLTVSADLAEQWLRILKAQRAAGVPLFERARPTRNHLARAGNALLPDLETLARRDPDSRAPILQALRVSRTRPELRAPFIGLGLSSADSPTTVLEALRAIDWTDVTRWEPRLEALAQTHPWDTVRWEARRKLERDVATGETLSIGGPHPQLEARRTRADYCQRGEPLAPRDAVVQMPPFERDVLGAWRHGLSVGGASAAHPARTRWLAGYDTGEFGGALASYDYATGAVEILLEDAVQLIAPDRPASLGTQPDSLFVFTGADHMGRRGGRVWAVAPDGDDAPRPVAELPGPVQRAFRLDDGSLLLHFHDDSAPFRSEVRLGSTVLGQSSSPPPLRLMPDGTVRPGCEGEDLAGEAPPLFP